MSGGFGPCCDRGDGDGSSGSSSRLLRPPKLLSPLAFASQPERGAGGGGGGGGGYSFGVVMGATRISVYHQKQFHGSIFFGLSPPSIFHGRSFLPIATSSSMTLNELVHDPREPSLRQKASWELFSALRNERCPRLESLSPLPPSDFPPQWKGWNFF